MVKELVLVILVVILRLNALLMNTGVNFTTIPPVTNTEVYSIVVYETFFEYLLKVAREYLSIYPQNKLIVEESLIQIQKRFDIEIKK
ncbi:ribonuclease toxin immunity protein CdiI [Lysinibacillus irui]|nr:ribonuclease toxin immunity protein CdiI [Lysinibacillus irui]MEA0563773.1 ribonuclease toxin immunity protein CdiI [Lysinibacillus irui]